MKVKCIKNEFTDASDPEFTLGSVYDFCEETGCLLGDDGWEWILDENLCFAGQEGALQFESVDNSDNTKEPMYIATLRSIQEQCSRANLSISIDPEGFNIFDCDTDMQVQVGSVADVIEILETKLEYQDSMGKWGWL